jgi:membrane protein implicated in regulation of membrane protease activity
VVTFDSAALGWAALAVASALVEIVVPHFGIIFAAMGATAAAVVALFGAGMPLQVVVFFVTTGAALALLRQRFVRGAAGHTMPSRAEAHVGREGIVTLDIDPIAGSGRVSVGGEDWAARSRMPIASGTRVRVVGSDGIVLEVTPT